MWNKVCDWKQQGKYSPEIAVETPKQRQEKLPEGRKGASCQHKKKEEIELG